MQTKYSIFDFVTPVFTRGCHLGLSGTFRDHMSLQAFEVGWNLCPKAKWHKSVRWVNVSDERLWAGPDHCVRWAFMSGYWPLCQMSRYERLLTTVSDEPLWAVTDHCVRWAVMSGYCPLCQMKCIWSLTNVSDDGWYYRRGDHYLPTKKDWGNELHPFKATEMTVNRVLK